MMRQIKSRRCICEMNDIFMNVRSISNGAKCMENGTWMTSTQERIYTINRISLFIFQK